MSNIENTAEDTARTTQVDSLLIEESLEQIVQELLDPEVLLGTKALLGYITSRMAAVENPEMAPPIKSGLEIFMDGVEDPEGLSEIKSGLDVLIDAMGDSEIAAPMKAFMDYLTEAMEDGTK